MISKMLAALTRNMTFVPQKGAHGYPLDLNGFESFTRPKTGTDMFPSHFNARTDGVGLGNFALLGYISPGTPQQNDFVWSQMYGKNGFGPSDGTPVQPGINSNINLPGLAKGTFN